MNHHLRSGRRNAGIAIVTVASLAVAGYAGGTSYASGGVDRAAATHSSARGSQGGTARDPYIDVTQTDRAVTKALRKASKVSRTPASKAFRAAAADGTVTDISGTTGTVRFRGNLNGFLTGPSKRSAKSIALGYVRSHAKDLGLVTADLATFHLARTYTDITGIRHLFFTQRVNGHPVTRNGLTASVNHRGRLLTLGGMPVTTAASTKLPAASALTITTAAEALAKTRGPEVPGAATGDDTAQRVVFETGTGLRPAWETVVTSSETPATTVIDAVTGAILLRTPLKQYEHSTGRAYHFFPGSRRGGHQVKVDFTKKGWLGPHAHKLSGNNSHAFSDVNDNNKASKSEEVHPLKGHSWGYRLKPFHPGLGAQRFCSNPWPCSWNPNSPFSWKVNRAQNATQVFFYVNNWHDHLLKAPIGFTPAAGNFQLKNHGKKGKGGDPVATQTDDGANTDNGLPDGAHIDNANMSTPPDGKRPTMQMYLQHQPGTKYPSEDPFSPTNVGDEADTVYHEYTHGLSNRLNVDVRGRSTLGGVQAGAMGEAWSDWYAMDYLVKKHLQRDRQHKVDVRLFVYDGEGVNFDRTEPLDCKVGSTARLCNGGETGHKGGYTYADYGKVIGGPEVHSDGEIWAQTLWDLRDRLGSSKSESIVTRAMELAPYNPSFIDMRNAILIADNSVFAGKDRHKIWKVFAHRGMGYFAGSLGGNDASPAASFAMPPASSAKGDIQGTVTDTDSSQPVAGVPVTLVFQGSGTANPTVVTDNAGHYHIAGVPVGHYAKLIVSGAGYEPGSTPVDVPANAAVTKDFQIRRDWAASSGGASASTPDGDNFSGCGVHEAIDLNEATVWSTGTSGSGTAYLGRTLVINLGHLINVAGFAIDPAAGCGDGASASLAGYQIQTSATANGPWVDAASGTFDTNDNGRLNEFAPTGGATGVQFVRLTMVSNQTPSYTANCSDGAGAYSGCAFTDLSEIEVFGSLMP